MIQNYKYIVFVEQKPAKPQKTKIFYIYPKGNLTHGASLGRVSWYSHWRTYCFFPASNTIFDADCLQDIKDFIQHLMLERQRQKKNTVAGVVKLIEDNTLPGDTTIFVSGKDVKI